MTNELNLTVPKADNIKPEKKSKLYPFFNIIFLITIIIGILYLSLKINNLKTQPEITTLPDPVLKELALKLENQGLHQTAAKTWKKYLKQTDLNANDSAKIFYRIGKLYQENNQYEKAIQNYYFSENLCKIPDLEDEISRKIQECLEAMGKFTALNHELQDRVGINTDKKDFASDDIIAEIGMQKITKSDLDLKIENMIDTQLIQLSNYLPTNKLNMQKQEMLKSFNSGQQKLSFLNQMILEEILYRKARENNLINDPEIQKILRAKEKSFLANQLIEKELKEKIHITDLDIKTYFEANKENYQTPANVQISHILVKTKDNALVVRNKLSKGESFKELVKEFSIDKNSSDKEGIIEAVIENNNQSCQAVFGNSKNARKIIFETEQGTICKNNIVSDKGIHIVKVLEKTAKKQKTFSEASNEVYQDLRKNKVSEVQTNLLQNLQNEYDVVIHHSKFINNDQKMDQTKK